VTVIVNEPVSDSPLDLPKSERDPDWFKRAVFYEVLVRSFQDSNGDGTGDLKGLTSSSTTSSGWASTASGCRRSSNPRCATAATTSPTTPTCCPSSATSATSSSSSTQAHQRGIRVIIDFVMNHTSDQHPWFQASRSDPRGAVRRLLRLGDDDKQFADARIIFVDTEPSNWTFDPVRKQYYWHRFFSHQPDLNYDNPGCRRRSGRAAVLARPRHRRLPARRRAVPLPARGHQLREPAGDARVPQAGAQDGRREYPDRVLLAEANQWPSDVVDYFGDPDRSATSATWLPLPGDAAHLHGGAPRVALPDLGDPGPDPGRSRPTASGASSCATTTS
jgi:maltose alpha-D-glucosyltransferase/alpha-amylase